MEERAAYIRRHSLSGAEAVLVVDPGVSLERQGQEEVWQRLVWMRAAWADGRC